MSTAQYIERRFRANKVYVTDKKRMGNHTRFELWCGLIVTVYDEVPTGKGNSTRPKSVMSRTSTGTRYSGTPYASNPEGALEWVPVDRILDLPLWDGDRQFLPLVFDDDLRAFHGVMPYRDGKMVSWAYSRI